MANPDIDPIIAPVFPGDAADGAEVIGTDIPARREAAQHGWRVLAVLTMLMGFASISTDLYLPAMPAMSHALGASAGMVEWTISGYLIGFSLGQLLWGPVGDRYGRRLPVAIGLVLFIIGSAGCALAGSIPIMIFWRVVQAVGACASVVLARAMVRDLYSGDRAAQMLSTLLTVMAIAPLIGPMLGGQILTYAGWRAIFWLLVGVGGATLIALATLPETLPKERRNHEPLHRAMMRYRELLRDRKFVCYAFAGGFYYAGIFAYLAGTPHAYISYYHVPAQYYGLLFGVGIVGIMATNFANSRMVMKHSSKRLLGRGTAVAALAGIALAFTSHSGWGGLVGLVIPLFLFVGIAGFVAANSIAGAMTNFPKHAGAASAMVGAIHYGCGVIGSAMVGVFADGTPWPMGAVIAVGGIGSFIFARTLKA